MCLGDRQKLSSTHIQSETPRSRHVRVKRAVDRIHSRRLRGYSGLTPCHNATHPAISSVSSSFQFPVKNDEDFYGDG
jgi:hypothetical protein